MKTAYRPLKKKGDLIDFRDLSHKAAEKVCLTLVAWREARGETTEGKAVVASSIIDRVKKLIDRYWFILMGSAVVGRLRPIFLITLSITFVWF
jgi:hypothetical protein